MQHLSDLIQHVLTCVCKDYFSTCTHVDIHNKLLYNELAKKKKKLDDGMFRNRVLILSACISQVRLRAAEII